MMKNDPVRDELRTRYNQLLVRHKELRAEIQDMHITGRSADEKAERLATLARSIMDDEPLFKARFQG